MKSILKNKAYKMFDQWVTNAKKEFPNLNYQIKELSALENDLEDVARHAIQSLLKEENLEKRKLSGYDFGFICGYVMGSLNVRWDNEYIQKQNNEYKMFAAIVALDSYLKSNGLLAIELKSLYQEYYKKEVNLDNPNTEIIVSIPDDLQFLEPEDAPNPILATFEALKIEKIKDAFKKDAPEFLVDVQQYFSEEEIKQLVSLYQD